MTQANTPPVGGWRVTGQRQTKVPGPGGTSFVDAIEVNYVTGYGVNGTVTLPMSQYNLPNVQAAISGQVAQLDAVSALTHQTTV